MVKNVIVQPVGHRVPYYPSRCTTHGPWGTMPWGKCRCTTHGSWALYNVAYPMGQADLSRCMTHGSWEKIAEAVVTPGQLSKHVFHLTPSHSDVQLHGRSCTTMLRKDPECAQYCLSRVPSGRIERHPRTFRKQQIFVAQYHGAMALVPLNSPQLKHLGLPNEQIHRLNCRFPLPFI
jgi:hypothetical protein